MILSLGVRTSNATINEAAWEIITGATPGRAKLLELGVFVAAATATTVGLGFAAAAGVTPTAPVDFAPEDSDNVLASGVVQSALAWGTSPTSPAKFFRRIALLATIGTGVIWTFPKGLVIPVSSSLVLWNITANPILDVYAVIEI